MRDNQIVNLDAVQWLRQQVTARLEKARSMLGEEWPDQSWAVTECSEHNCPCIVYQGTYVPFTEPQVPPIRYIADAETPELAQWIAANDPRDAIARCEAELGILEKHSGRKSDHGGHGFKDGDLACTTCGVDDGWWGVPWPCQTVRDVASGYRHRPGYLEHWGGKEYDGEH